MAGTAKKIMVPLLRWIVGGVFIYAGVLKVLDPAQFARDVDNYRLLSFPLACGVGVYLPWLEIIAASAFILGICRAGAALLLGGMLAVFFIALTSAWVRGLDIQCGCFGHGTNASNYPLALLLDAAMLAALVFTQRRAAN